MRVEFSESCGRCDKRPACEIAGIKGRNLEDAAKKLGFTITEGSVLCPGSIYESVLERAVCKARVLPPELASAEEHEKITALADLEVQAGALIEDTRNLVKEIAG